MVDPYQYLKDEPYKLYINGEFVPSESKETMEVVNPVDNEVIATFYKGGKEDIKKAIKSARKAFEEGPWSSMSQKERSELIKNVGRKLMENKEKFACLEGLDCGKLYPSLTFYELPQAVDGFNYSAGKARCIEGKEIPVDGGGHYLNYVKWQPYGVVGEILPWNGPLMMGCQKVSSILAAGNTVVIKPPSCASLSLLELASVFEEAGFPPGVVNIVSGTGSEVGNYMAQSQDIDMLSLTGGVETGKKIIENSSDTIKEIALELGGKNPNIMFDDINIKQAAKWALYGFTLNSGQVCVSGSRLLLQDTIYNEFVDELKKLCKDIKPGNGFDYEDGVNFGPLISREHYQTVHNYIQKGKKEGARVVCGGEEYKDPKLKKGNFIPPTIFADVTPDMTIFQEEIFGPVLTVTKFHSEEEAVNLANRTKYGLACGIFTRDIKKAHRIAEKIQSGQVYINTYYSKGIMESPGVGWKKSGLGKAGIYKYMQRKTIFVDLEEGSLPPV